MNNELYITFVKTIFMNLCIAYSLLKIINYTDNNKYNTAIIILLNIMMSSILVLFSKFFKYYIDITYITLSIYFIYTFLLTKIFARAKFIKTIIVSSICIVFGYITIILASVFNFFLTRNPFMHKICYGVMEFFIIGIMQIIIVFCFFKIKRFRNGFSYISGNNNVNISNAIDLIISITILLICIIYGICTDNKVGTFLMIELAVVGIFMFYWIRKSITKYYKERMKDRTVELQSEQLKEKDEIISNLNQELSNVLEINHKYNKRLSAMEKAIGNLGNKLSFNEEFAKEYSDILDSLKDLAKEYKQEFENYNILPKTNIFSIDNLLDYMKTEAIRNSIEFELEINKNINELIEKHISKSKLETLLGDHIADAITAINASDNSYKKIKVILGKDKEFYKISVLDTGIEFEIETLLKLGLERITTHKDSGGTGIGFMTTFETLKECKASLIIEEYNNEKEYTKSVNVIFDGKSEYNINSYRDEKINHKTRTIE